MYHSSNATQWQMLFCQKEWQVKYACAHQKVPIVNIRLPREKQNTQKTKKDVTLKIKGLVKP